METRDNVLLGCARRLREKIRPRRDESPETPAEETLSSTAAPSITTSLSSIPRRAIADDLSADPRAWLKNLAAAGVIGILGLGMAGAVATSGAANPTPDAVPTALVSISDQVSEPDEFAGRDERSARNAPRGLLEDRAAEQRRRQKETEKSALDAARQDRAKALDQSQRQTEENRKRLDSDVPSVWPLTNFTVNGRWHEYGPWARWHTGVDLSTSLGSPIVAPAGGIVEHAGAGGGAGSWAGCYVVLRHNDGKATLYAHMNCAMNVSVGQTVAAGTQLGHVGMTGRTFGPHLHLELYPAGAVPGDIYSTMDPLPWLQQAG